MLYYNKIAVSEGIDSNESNKSIESMNCHYWCFLDSNYTYEPEVCNGCHDISLITNKLENIAIFQEKSIDYRCILWTMTKNYAINMFNNSKLNDKFSL